jgi:hypothetical protein
LYLDSRKDGLSQRFALANNPAANAADEGQAGHEATMMFCSAHVKTLKNRPKQQQNGLAAAANCQSSHSG